MVGGNCLSSYHLYVHHLQLPLGWSWQTSLSIYVCLNMKGMEVSVFLVIVAQVLILICSGGGNCLFAFVRTPSQSSLGWMWQIFPTAYMYLNAKGNGGRSPFYLLRQYKYLIAISSGWWEFPLLPCDVCFVPPFACWLVQSHVKHIPNMEGHGGEY